VPKKLITKWALVMRSHLLHLYLKAPEAQNKKESILKKSHHKNKKWKNTKYNRRKQNHAYRCKYLNRRNKNRNNHQGNRDIFKPNWSNKIYFRGSDG
jgi:hypothetical protein